MLPRHQFRGRAATRAAFPALRPSVRFTATYFDAWISYPSALNRACRRCHGPNGQALALNYARIAFADGGLILTDPESGQTLSVQARIIVNATGAWIDDSAASLGARMNERLVSVRRGSHLILENPALMAALNGQMVYFEHSDGRVCVVFPYLGRVLAGSTDLRVNAAGRTAAAWKSGTTSWERCRSSFRPSLSGPIRSSTPMPGFGRFRQASRLHRPHLAWSQGAAPAWRVCRKSAWWAKNGRPTEPLLKKL